MKNIFKIIAFLLLISCQKQYNGDVQLYAKKGRKIELSKSVKPEVIISRINISTLILYQTRAEFDDELWNSYVATFGVIRGDSVIFISSLSRKFKE